MKASYAPSRAGGGVGGGGGTLGGGGEGGGGGDPGGGLGDAGGGGGNGGGLGLGDSAGGCVGGGGWLGDSACHQLTSSGGVAAQAVARNVINTEHGARARMPPAPTHSRTPLYRLLTRFAHAYYVLAHSLHVAQAVTAVWPVGSVTSVAYSPR